ncbi:LysR family transcriptional regulator, partial [Pseudoalteromonas sp. XMcav1-K]|uniref:LysR family transcriptional regulator n=1 Tax=Pseudoalteromonas sp. XMcav1-K TaxID=3374372 RepID=UPI00375656C8
MKIELLTTFLEVSQTLHVRVAADNLYLTQAAVSSRIKQLEEELGVQLFDRTQKRLKLTAEGYRLVKHANEMLIMWQKLKQDVGVAQPNAYQLFVGSMMSIWDIVLQDWLQKIHRNLDDVHLYTHTYSPLELRKQVISRLVDIAFLFEPPFTEDIMNEKVATVPLQLVSTDRDMTLHNIENMVMV